MYKFIWKRIELLSFVSVAFILGCTITISLIPIDKTCKIDDTDREYNIMKNSKFNNPEVIILILSAPTNYEKRNTIRETWLKLRSNEENNKLYRIKHYFVIGNLLLSKIVSKRLNDEQINYNDILILPIKDSYKNLTEKIKYSFQWLDLQYDYGLVFKYVLKCDDDSFVNIKEVIRELMIIEKLYINNNTNTNTNRYLSINYQYSDNINKKSLSLYWGYFNGNALVKSKGKWKESNWIASDKYLPYALGGGYILSKDLISFISKNLNKLKSFNSEDVSVGLWLISVNNLLRIHDIRFDTEWISRGCKNTHLITHNISPLIMKQFYNNLINTGKICNREFVKRNFYIYDWTLPPSQCCKINSEKIIQLNGK